MKRYQHWCLFVLGALSCISDACRAQKDISIGIFLCLAPFLHPLCTPSMNTHHVSVFSCSAHLLHSLKHAEHENTLVSCLAPFPHVESGLPSPLSLFSMMKGLPLR